MDRLRLDKKKQRWALGPAALVGHARIRRLVPRRDVQRREDGVRRLKDDLLAALAHPEAEGVLRVAVALEALVERFDIEPFSDFSAK